eukprot:7390106-Prymnesium_polylepis.1
MTLYADTCATSCSSNGSMPSPSSRSACSMISSDAFSDSGISACKRAQAGSLRRAGAEWVPHGGGGDAWWRVRRVPRAPIDGTPLPPARWGHG